MRLLRVIACTLAFCGLTAPAFATPITQLFSVTATTGPLIGQSSSGQFAYDSGSIPLGGNGTVSTANLLTDLDFVWNGITYTEATANTGFLIFASGTLTGGMFGSPCFPGYCVSSTGVEGFVFEILPSVFAGFDYNMAGNPGFFHGTATFDAPAAVPEPASLLLLGTGVASALAARRRKKQSS